MHESLHRLKQAHDIAVTVSGNSHILQGSTAKHELSYSSVGKRLIVEREVRSSTSARAPELGAAFRRVERLRAESKTGAGTSITLFQRRRQTPTSLPAHYMAQYPKKHKPATPTTNLATACRGHFGRVHRYSVARRSRGPSFLERGVVRIL